tara:strand:+ start:1930 stop:2739 length:810 start_codon:yes stop_codon:yes gene_type:complete
MISYEEHYEKARKANPKMDIHSSKYSSLYNLTLDLDYYPLDAYYLNLVKAVSEKVSKKLDSEKGVLNSRFVKYLDDWRDIEEIYQLANLIMPRIEKDVFHCNLKIEFVLPYKNKKDTPSKSASWLWHYDDCPREYLKFAIYLNETNKNNGCFQYIDSAETTPLMPSSRLYDDYNLNPAQHFHGSRIPEYYIENLLKNGAREKSLVGPAGTNFLFTPNIIHRGTIPDPKTQAREAIMFFIRPSVERGKYIDDKTCSIIGSQKRVKRYVMD